MKSQKSYGVDQFSPINAKEKFNNSLDNRNPREIVTPTAARNMPPPLPPGQMPAQTAVARSNVFNPPNPNATGMNFNNTAYRPPSDKSGSLDGRVKEPSIGASLMDQEGVTLNANLQAKKKKKKAKKKLNSLVDRDQGDFPAIGKSSLINAGSSIGHGSGDGEKKLDALPELDLDDGANDGDADSSWNYNDFAGAKVQDAGGPSGPIAGSGTINSGTNQVSAKKFDINDLNASGDSDFL